VLGHHGALAGEQEHAQPFELDIVFSYDMDRAASSDDLGAAVDYGVVTSRAARVVSEQRFALLEALGDAVGRAVLEDERIASVQVRLHKLRPPVALDVASIGIVRRLSRASLASAPDRTRA
jgi:dihydroneopterin aldolase